MNTRMIPLFSMAIVCLLLASCAGSKKLAYMQTLSTNVETKPGHGIPTERYESSIKPKDLLSITVVTSEPGASKNYNLLVPQISDVANNIYSMPTMQLYLVDNDGCIDFPVLGKINVAGITRKELETNIQKGLEPAFSKERPIITIRITNYSVNILGEVSRPGKYLSTNDRLTIFEGLALAGDMTIYGRRDNVKVLREYADGSKALFCINLNDKNIVDSKAYFLEQNDVVYVEPNKSRSKSSYINSAETLSVSAMSILISIASLVVNILR